MATVNEKVTKEYRKYRMSVEASLRGGFQVTVFRKSNIPIFCTWSYANAAEALNEARKTIDGFSSGHDNG